MRRVLHAATLSGVLAMFLASSVSGRDKHAPQPVSGKIEWVYDYEQGKLETPDPQTDVRGLSLREMTGLF